MESLFESNSILIMGLLAGFVFGFLLRKGMVTRFDIIVGQFLLKDFTVIKIMLSAILVGSICVYTMLEIGFLETLPVKNAFVLANISGGMIFGIGMATLGLCPGTCVGAVAEGSIDGFFGLIGMLCGAALFAEVYDWLYVLFFEPVNLGKMTLSTLTGGSAWIFIAGLTLISLTVFVLIENHEKKSKIEKLNPL